ncbi:hypothetical protein KI659_12040 [Litoribacter alkaliphilus]|uniref:Lipoprotein n=1 Tax=Litoribacter ruber TaxID=702568 RepID=A0AAP2CIY1_9BACT|nr:hypothetical protein [Litoribacter alkaliphilus]MBS9524740.1 hypothetical protein [Litoribacter alkaliphilus]
MARFYHTIIFIWFLFGCGDQQKDSISQEVIQKESEEIHELINQLIEEKFHIFYYDFDSLVFLAEETSTEWKENHIKNINNLNQFVELQKTSIRPHHERISKVENIFTEEDFQMVLTNSTVPFQFHADCLSDDIYLLSKEYENQFPEIAMDSLGINEFTFLKVSKPTFLMDFQYAWTFLEKSSWSGFMSSGSGFLAVYEKVNGKWEYIFSIQLYMS